MGHMADEQPAAAGGAEPLRLSFSRIDTYRLCPLQYRYANVDRLPQQPAPHLSWGTSVHGALEWWWRALPGRTSAPPQEQLLAALYENWDDSGFEGMDRAEKVKWYRHAQDVLRRHHERHAAGWRPAKATEQRFEVEMVPGVVVAGLIDHVEQSPADPLGYDIVDWKTSRKPKPRHEVEKSLQLAIYAVAAEHLWGAYPAQVAFDFVVPGMRVAVPFDHIDIDSALETISETAEAIRAERFDPTPQALCGWCAYRSVCPMWQGDGPDVPGAAVVELGRLRRRRKRDEAREAELVRIVGRRGLTT